MIDLTGILFCKRDNLMKFEEKLYWKSAVQTITCWVEKFIPLPSRYCLKIKVGLPRQKNGWRCIC